MSTIVGRIEQFLKDCDIKQSHAEAAMGLANGTLASAFKRGSSIKTENLELFLKTYPEADPLWICGGMKKNEDVDVLMEKSHVYSLRTDRFLREQRVPLYNIEATAGLVSLFRHQGDERPIDYISIPNLPKCDGAIFVTGDSMYPLLKSGDIVMYKEISNVRDGLFWGEMYLLSIDLEGEEYVSVKYVQKSDRGEEYIKLVSQNGHHNPMDVLLSRVRALALVKASIRVNSMR